MPADPALGYTLHWDGELKGFGAILVSRDLKMTLTPIDVDVIGYDVYSSLEGIKREHIDWPQWGDSTTVIEERTAARSG